VGLAVFPEAEEEQDNESQKSKGKMQKFNSKVKIKSLLTFYF